MKIVEMIIRPCRFAVPLAIVLALSAPVLGSMIVPSCATENAVDLLQHFERLYSDQKYPEATDAGLAALAALERQFGHDSLQVGAMLNQLAWLYRLQNRYREAEPLYKRAIAIYEKLIGRSNVYVANTLDNLASLYDDQSRYDQAEPLYKRSIEIKEGLFGRDHPNVAPTLNNLATLYSHHGRFGDAEALFKRVLKINERAPGADQSGVATTLYNLAMLYARQGRLSEAEPFFIRSLSIDEQRLGPNNPDLARVLDGLADVYFALGRYAKAEPLYRRSLEINERSFGRDHPNTAGALSKLGAFYTQQARNEEAESLLKRSLAIYEKTRPDDPAVADVADRLAALYSFEPGRLRRRAEAELFLKRSLAIREKAFGPRSIPVGRALNNLALHYYYYGRFADADNLYKRSLEIHEAVAAEHPELAFEHASVLMNLGLLYHTQGHLGEAERFYRRALTIYQQTLVPDAPLFINILHNLAMLSAAKGDWKSAADFWRRVTELIVRRADVGGQSFGQPPTGKSESEIQQLSYMFQGLVKASYRQAAQAGHVDEAAAREMFPVAQWIFASPAAQSLAQMAARAAAHDARIAALLREKQDLEAEWQWRDRMRNLAIGQVAEKPDREAVSQNASRLASIEARALAIDTQIRTALPEYAAFANPKPLSVVEVQALIGGNEAFVFFLDSNGWDDETFIWVVTKAGVRWVRADLGTARLAREITALRCGLDYDEEAWRTPSSRCSALLNTTFDRTKGQPLPFDLSRAYRLYRALFDQFEDVIKGKQLLIVSSGPLTQLPLQVLVTEAPPTALPKTFAAYRDIAWLARQHAVSVLPSVASLKSLREVAGSSRVAGAYIGFGNPLLDGDPSRYPDDAKAAKEAREAHCSPRPEPTASSSNPSSSRLGVFALKDNGLADVVKIRHSMPLPETADELCRVAQELGEPASQVHIGPDATESMVKRLSADGTLSKYKIVHFATHGVLAGRLSADAEPGLIMTPPDKASDFDDGYLTASEIAKLKLDADWAILSACNTAAGETEGAEALSGLARAFFHAGARSLLVSNWAVNSQSTVKLITKAVELSAHASAESNNAAVKNAHAPIGRATALQQSMLALITDGEPHEAHPAFWAPFALVGEGSAAH